MWKIFLVLLVGVPCTSAVQAGILIARAMTAVETFVQLYKVWDMIENDASPADVFCELVPAMISALGIEYDVKSRPNYYEDCSKLAPYLGFRHYGHLPTNHNYTQLCEKLNSTKVLKLYPMNEEVTPDDAWRFLHCFSLSPTIILPQGIGKLRSVFIPNTKLMCPSFLITEDLPTPLPRKFPPPKHSPVKTPSVQKNVPTKGPSITNRGKDSSLDDSKLKDKVSDSQSTSEDFLHTNKRGYDGNNKHGNITGSSHFSHGKYNSSKERKSSVAQETPHDIPGRELQQTKTQNGGDGASLGQKLGGGAVSAAAGAAKGASNMWSWIVGGIASFGSILSGCVLYSCRKKCVSNRGHPQATPTFPSQHPCNFGVNPQLMQAGSPFPISVNGLQGFPYSFGNSPIGAYPYPYALPMSMCSIPQQMYNFSPQWYPFGNTYGRRALQSNTAESFL